MTATLASATEAGRTCPYCRFALKNGVAVERCSVCEAVYHEDCWRDGAGCSVFGCAGAGTATMMAVPASPPAAAAQPGPPLPAALYPPPPAPRSSSGLDTGQIVLIAVLALVLIGAAGFGGYLLTRTHTPRTATLPPSSRAAAAGTATAAPTATQTPPPAPTLSPNQVAARRMEAVIAFSQTGRRDVQSGDYPGAIANRERALAKLRALHGTTGAVATARRTLERAMRASLAADRAYETGADASTYDAEATALKEQFSEEWSSVADRYGLRSYDPDEI
jgi:hypothetical protein